MTDEQHLLLLKEEEQRQRTAKRSRSFRDVAKGMHRTHRLGISGAIATTSFPAATLSRPITFQTQIEVTGLAAEGIVFEFGDSTTGVKVWLEGADTIAAAAGDGGGASNTGTDGNVIIAALGDVGFRADIVAAFSPGEGAMRVWVNGQLVIRLASNNPWTSNSWAASSAGVVGGIQNGTSNSRSAVNINTAPVDFAIVRQLEAFVGQLPKQFDESIRAYS